MQAIRGGADRARSRKRSGLGNGCHVGGEVKKAFPIVMDEGDLIEHHRLLINDAEAAFEWIQRHPGGKTLRLLEGG